MNKLMLTHNWSVDYEGRHVFELCALKPKMSYKEIKEVIINEGGFIDDKGFICAGSAVNKIVERNY